MADRVDSSVASIKDKEDLSFSPLPNYDGFSQAEKAEQGSIVQDVSPLEVSSLEEWKPSRQFKIIFLVQCVVQCAVALDATIFTTTLPVSSLTGQKSMHRSMVLISLPCRTLPKLLT